MPKTSVIVPTQNEVYNFIVHNPGVKAEEITRALVIKADDTAKFLKGLVASGHVKKTGVTSATTYKVDGRKKAPA